VRYNQAPTPFGHCPSKMFLPVRPHCVNARRNRCQDHLNSFPFGELDEATRTPSYYMDVEYPAGPEIQQPCPEWSNQRVSDSSTLETDDCLVLCTPSDACLKRRRSIATIKLYVFFNLCSCLDSSQNLAFLTVLTFLQSLGGAGLSVLSTERYSAKVH